MASFDNETIESDLEETQRRYSKTPSSTMLANTNNSLMSSPSGEDYSPIKGRMSTQKGRSGSIVDKRPHDRKGLSISLLKRVRNFRTFILRNPQYREETSKWSSKSEPYNRLEELNVLAAYDYNLKEGRLYLQSKPFEGNVSSDLFDATSLSKEWIVIQRALTTAWKNKLFPPELQKSAMESSEEENSDHGDSGLSTNPEPVRPEVRNQLQSSVNYSYDAECSPDSGRSDKRPSTLSAAGELRRSHLPRIQSNHGHKQYGDELKDIQKLIEEQNNRLEEQSRRTDEALTEMMRYLRVATEKPIALSSITPAVSERPASTQPTNHLSMSTQLNQSPDCGSQQTPPLETTNPSYSSIVERIPAMPIPQTPPHIGKLPPLEWQRVAGEKSGGSMHTLSTGDLHCEPGTPVEWRQKQDYHPLTHYGNPLTARSDVLEFKIYNIGMFKPPEGRTVDQKGQIYYEGKEVVFSDVDLWMQSVDTHWPNVSDSQRDTVTRSLWTLLRGPAIIWWHQQLDSTEREILMGSKEKMFKAVKKEFGLEMREAAKILHQARFGREEIMSDTSVREFASRVFHAARTYGETSDAALLARLYNALDPALQAIINAPISTENRSQYLRMIEEKRKALRELYQKREDAGNDRRFHLVENNGYPHARGSDYKPVHNTYGDFCDTENSNSLGPQHFDRRNNHYPNNWSYEGHGYNSQNDQYFQGNSRHFQLNNPNFHNYDPGRHLSQGFGGQQQGYNHGGGLGYYNDTFGTNNPEVYWNPHVAEHSVGERVPYTISDHAIGYNPSRHLDQDRCLRGGYPSQHEKNGY